METNTLTPAPAAAQSQEWAPSMFTIRVQDDAGQWIIYNSMTGAMGVIPKEKENALLPLLKDGTQDPLEGDALNFLQRGFLVPRGADERRRAVLLKQNRQASRAMHLILMPTEDCNFRCRYCYESFLRGRMKRKVRQGIRNLVAQTAPSLERLDVGWFGGEPMEELDVIEELSHFMIGVSRARGVAYSSNIVTNGSHLTPANLKRLLACEVRSIQVTLDGPPDHHDKLRIRKDGQPTFEAIWENLKAARKVPGEFSLSLRINFNPETLPSLDHFLATIAAEFADDKRFSVFFRPVGQWGGPNDSSVDICTQQQGETAQFDMARVAQKTGLQSGATYAFMKPGGSVCYAANPRSFVIGSDGIVYKCTVALDKDFNKVGKLLPDGRMEMDQDRFALWVTSDDSEDKVCQSCSFRPACQGAACPLIRIETGRRPCPPFKNRMRRALLAVWDHYRRFGKPEPAGMAAAGARD